MMPYCAVLHFRIWPPMARLRIRPNPDPRVFCSDCGTNTCVAGGDYYMVANDLWEEFGNGDGMLCLTCLSARVGRPLAIYDFTAAPVNNLIRFGFALRGGSVLP
jgi:hypothetical protein